MYTEEVWVHQLLFLLLRDFTIYTFAESLFVFFTDQRVYFAVMFNTCSVTDAMVLVRAAADAAVDAVSVYVRNCLVVCF